MYTVSGAVAQREKIEINCITEIFKHAELTLASKKYGQALVQILEGFQ
jgi:hypothetical protein